MDFPLLNDLQETTELCDRHGVKKVQIKEFAPFCQLCQKEKLDQQEQDRVMKCLNETTVGRRLKH